METNSDVNKKKVYIIKVKTMDNNVYDFDFDPI